MFKKKFIWFFTARRYASAVCAVVVYLSVCPSVRPSHANIVQKRLNLGSRKQRRIARFLMPKISAKFQRGYPQLGSK